MCFYSHKYNAVAFKLDFFLFAENLLTNAQKLTNISLKGIILTEG